MHAYWNGRLGRCEWENNITIFLPFCYHFVTILLPFLLPFLVGCFHFVTTLLPFLVTCYHVLPFLVTCYILLPFLGLDIFDDVTFTSPGNHYSRDLHFELSLERSSIEPI